MASNEPSVIAADWATVSYSGARIMWEAADFGAWIEMHGFPVTINGVEYDGWKGVEDALSDDTWDA